MSSVNASSVEGYAAGDLEKQSHGHEDASEHPSPLPDSGDAEKQGGIKREPSSTCFDPVKAPDYTGDGQSNPAKPTRTFSRREMTQIDSNHPFGGDLDRRHTEQDLVRFSSQQGKYLVMVHWEGEGDPENPQNWSRNYRWYLTLLSGLLVLNSTFTSSAPSGVIPQMMVEFGFSRLIGTLTVAIFVAGYVLGPLLWGPLSERLGRKPVFLIAMVVYTGFNVGCALSKNTASILVFRFLSGTFAASPLTNSGGVIADIWDARTRGIALSIFSLAPFAGPALGPIVGGFIGVSGTSWRWLFWVCTIFSGVCLALVVFTLPETYAPIIMIRKAKRIRKETGEDRYKAPMELSRLKPAEMVHATLAKPFIMLAQEPMLLALTIYLSFVYGVVYLLFEAFPIVFSQGHGFNAGVTGLMFIFFFGGGAIGVLLYVIHFNPQYVKKADELHSQDIMRVPPEARLIVLQVAAPCLVVSFFWFGWTSYSSIHWISPALAGALIGFAVLLLFLGVFNYIIDTYLQNAASALSANTVVRSTFGAGFPMFATQMFETLNPRWASTVLGVIALVLLPIPFVLSKYGPKIRALSKHAA